MYYERCLCLQGTGCDADSTKRLVLGGIRPTDRSMSGVGTGPTNFTTFLKNLSDIFREPLRHFQRTYATSQHCKLITKTSQLTMTDATIRAFVAEQRNWLLKELQCDNEANASTEEGRSHVLHQLEALDVSVGLYGRTVLTLGPIVASSNSNALLPAHRFATGDEVEIRSKAAASAKKVPGGVISQVTETSISVALFDDMESDSEHLTPPLSILPKSSIEIHKKLMMALDDLEKHGANHLVAGAVVRAAFEAPSTEERPSSGSVVNSIQPFSDQLNESQLDAISFALTENRPVSLIHGPPGTG